MRQDATYCIRPRLLTPARQELLKPQHCLGGTGTDAEVAKGRARRIMLRMAV